MGSGSTCKSGVEKWVVGLTCNQWMPVSLEFISKLMKLDSSQSMIAQGIVQISFLLDERFYIDRNMALTSCISFLQVLDYLK